MTDDDEDLIDILWLSRGESIDVDATISDILDDNAWTDPVPAYEDLVRMWPNHPDL
ncbi:hypothetical protein GII30_22225 [Gordonia amarae]|uniref:Uncharacterized protein n=2 Tax=Gordonia amarae TaxID=36821 RepID=G7GLU2_9ACTN|nr:hypothetical protein [Gordonia amarae]MCS3876502.1 hypothetical protein [Gordonia amarae]QHN19410.1 hypothetical protein GII35_22690 [Gordonia amarae]QHN23886.1 hypothetical protein GII34_22190 [Gordonia amarae]QHN32796.1 hypothetical protein GII32_22520 [Gordonia amarae]QHN41515.1 hypothetical protein GII30_22225 [Gordonia amarae]